MGCFADVLNALQANPDHNAATCTTYNYDSSNVSAPDLCWARQANVKMGIGLKIEQSLSDNIGLFLRGMYSDGQTEVFSYTSSYRSLALGTLITGALWRRAHDTLCYWLCQ